MSVVFVSVGEREIRRAHSEKVKKRHLVGQVDLCKVEIDDVIIIDIVSGEAEGVLRMSSWEHTAAVQTLMPIVI